MKYKVLPSKRFLKDVKRLKKKYANILEDIDGIVRMIEKNPKIGINVFDNVYKIRLKSSDIKKGKSGSFRMIYYIVTEEKEVYLLTIYFKGEKEEISRTEIGRILKEI